MKLYYTQGACSLVVRIIMNEIGIKSEFESVDLHTKKTEKGDDFLKINPKGSVPVIKTDDGEILTENAVILQYLADTNSATKLLPGTGDFKRYRVLEWLNYVTTELHKTIGALFNPDISDEVKEKIYRPMIKTKLSFVDKNLTHKYLLGDEFTLPDPYLFVMLTWALHFKFDLSEWPNLSRFFAELKQRKSIHQSLVEEKLES